MFSGVRDLLNAFSGVGYSFNAFNGYFGGPGIDLASVQKVGNTLGAFDGLLQSISWLSQIPARVFGSDPQGQRTSVFANASSYPRLDFATVLRQPEREFSDLDRMVNGGPAVSLGPTMRQIGDGEPVRVSISPEQLTAMSTFRRGAGTVATYGRGGVQYDSVREYFDKNRYPFSA